VQHFSLFVFNYCHWAVWFKQ